MRRRILPPVSESFLSRPPITIASLARATVRLGFCREIAMMIFPKPEGMNQYTGKLLSALICAFNSNSKVLAFAVQPKGVRKNYRRLIMGK